LCIPGSTDLATGMTVMIDSLLNTPLNYIAPGDSQLKVTVFASYLSGTPPSSEKFIFSNDISYIPASNIITAASVTITKLY